MNGEVQADASNLLENDTVLVLFRAFGEDEKTMTISPPCHNDTIRTGCGFGGVPCHSNLRVPNVYSFSFSMFYYFRPVLMRDNGLTISFIRQRLINYTLDSVTLNGKSM